MFELKPLTKDGIEAAMKKTERYRLLGEPWESASICRDVLAIDPNNQQALTVLILSLTDQFRTKPEAVREARALLDRLDGAYERKYYSGIICERQAKAQLSRENPGSGFTVHDRLREAMTCYEEAEKIRPSGNDDAIIRWNTCARLIMEEENIRPRPEDDFQPMLE